MIEAIILGLALGYNGAKYMADLISEGDWGKMTGPHGGMFLLAIAVAALWFNKISSDKSRAKELAILEEKEDARRLAEEAARELRHAESLKASGDYAHSMKALAVESMKVTMMVNNSLRDLTKELASRPCRAATLIPDPVDQVTLTTPQPPPQES